MKTYTVCLYPPSGYKQTIMVRAETFVQVSQEGRTWIHFQNDDAPLLRTLVIGHGMSYFMSAVDADGNEVPL